MSDATDTQPRRSWRERLFAGLTKTRQQIGGSVRSLFARGQVDDELLEELEALLLSADVGVEATIILIEDLRQRARKQNLQTPESIQAAMVDCLTDLLQPLEAPLQITPPPGSPFVIMVAGINGAGKTTTLGKLAHHFQAAGHSVLLAAGDTFRAAAREQLQAWGERNNVTVIAQEGGDPSAVIFDAVHAAKARGIDIVLADTAGRLPTQMHLMDEIAKIRRVITKAEETAPHEVLLVLDGTIGQNAIGQVKAFDKSIGVTGLVITKLDGSAKGGVIAAIAKQCPKPVRYIGVGEQVEDLQPFSARAFAEALLG
ncbi:MAG: signal recognition particle-docking protein FtsY [Fluviibacter sp.]|jgi:fused signal recognition particle receptor